MEIQNRKLLQMHDAGGSDILPPPVLRQHEPFTHLQNTTSSASPPSRIQSPFDTSMALTILVLFTALFFMGLFSIYIRRFAEDSTAAIPSRSRRSRSREQSGGPPSSSLSRALDSRKGLDPQTIRSLPVHRYGEGAKYLIGDCAICLSEFEEGETVRMIPQCEHLFHVPCVDTWLSSHVSCPVCRNTRLFADKEGGGGYGGLRVMQGTLDQCRSEVSSRSTVDS